MADQSLQGTWSREGKGGGREGRREGKGGRGREIEGGRKKEREGGGRRMIGFTKLEELLNMARAVQPTSGTC